MQKKKMRSIIAAAAAVVIIGGAGALYISDRAYAAEEAQPAFREYTVSKGSITVGAEESGTISVERTYITFPCSAEVTEIYVKEGVTVNKGDPVMKLSADDIADAQAELAASVTSAEISLRKAETDRETKLLEAKQTLERSLAQGESAGSEYDIFIAQNNSSKETASKQLENSKTSLAEYEDMNITYPAAYEKLTAYENKLDEYESEYKKMEAEYKALAKIDSENSENTDTLQDEYDDYKKSISDSLNDIAERRSRYETAKENYDKASEEYLAAKETAESNSSTSIITSSSSQSSDSSAGETDKSTGTNTSTNTNDYSKKLAEAEKAKNAAYDELLNAKIAYSDYYKDLADKYSDKQEEYEDRISELKNVQKAHEKETSAYKTKLDELNDKISDLRSEYEDYKSDFTEIYGQNDADSISDMIDSLKDSISKTKLDIEADASAENGKILSAMQQAQSAEAEAQSAQAVYDQTSASLDSEVEKAQRTYDSALKNYNKFTENISDDGVVYAECGGIISSVNVSEGNSVQANMNLVTIMDTRYIYLSASVSEEDITSLYVGQDCSVSLTSYENKSFPAKIDTISAEPARSSGSVTYTVKVKLDDESGLNVREGMTGEIAFLQKQVSDVLYVNVNAVKFRDGVSYVTVYDDKGNAAEKAVITGFTDGRNVEISDGVSAGDKVLAEIELSGGKNEQRSR